MFELMAAAYAFEINEENAQYTTSTPRKTIQIRNNLFLAAIAGNDYISDIRRHALDKDVFLNHLREAHRRANKPKLTHPAHFIFKLFGIIDE